MTQPDMDLMTSRESRDRLAHRVDVLDKVKALVLLSDDTHATTEMVAAYYEVGIEAVKSAVKDHRAEVERDGYRTIEGPALRSLKDLCEIPPQTRSLALFPRRAILRVGMLLSDSDVARRVRDHLLDVEEGSRGNSLATLNLADLDVTDPQVALVLARMVQQQATAVIEQRQRADQAEARVVELEPAAANWKAVEAGDGPSIREFHKKYFSAVNEKAFFEHLYTRNYLINQRGKGGWSERRQCYRDGSQHRHPSFKGKPYLYLHASVDRSETRRENTRVRSGQPELDFRAVLIREGLVANHTSTDLERRPA